MRLLVLHFHVFYRMTASSDLEVEPVFFVADARSNESTTKETPVAPPLRGMQLDCTGISSVKESIP
jgi:hypothetical protein